MWFNGITLVDVPRAWKPSVGDIPPSKYLALGLPKLGDHKQM